MAKIQVLPSTLIDQIAAGEVIERPYSVVKELIENSIDAGATKILVSIKNAGKDLIQVLDNGEGMTPEDCRLAIQRHATSKLKTIQDLYSLQTMGFRGEALASIGSISDLEITTNQDEETAGFQLAISNGKIKGEHQIGFTKGTRITVKNIFQAIPARLKFLKSNTTEIENIKNRILCFALIYNKIEFQLMEENKTLLHFPARSNKTQRLADCLGNHLIKNLIFFTYKESYLSFQGFFSLPEYCRINKKLQFEYINKRHIKNRHLNNAIYKGYEGLLMKHMHPIYLIELQIDPAEVDVNVHPMKTQVHLKNNALVHTIISQQIRSQMREKTRGKFFPSFEKTSKSSHFQASEKPNPKTTSGFRFGGERTISAKNFSSEIFQQKKNKSARNFPSHVKEEPLKVIPSQSIQEQQKFAETNITTEKNETNNITILGVFKKYLLVQIEQKLAIIDVHAAHERIRFEELQQKFLLAKEKQEAIQLLHPLTISLSNEELEQVGQHSSLLEKNGFQLEKKDGQLLLKKIPPYLVAKKNQEEILKDFFLEILEELENSEELGKTQNFTTRALQTMACHSSFRGQRDIERMNYLEKIQLVQQIYNGNIDIYCPHGRPIILFYDEKEMDKLFKRT